jgi:hypothetical protein
MALIGAPRQVRDDKREILAARSFNSSARLLRDAFTGNCWMPPHPA